MEKKKVVELTLKVSLTPTVDMAKLREYNPELSEAIPYVFDACKEDTTKEPAYVDVNVTMDMTDALIEWHKANVERPGGDGTIGLESDVIIPAIKEAFAQACDMAIKDAIYADPDAKAIIVHDYRKDDTATMEGENV